MSLKLWYPSTEAKRKLGWLVQRLNETGERLGFGGSPDASKFFLEDVDEFELDGSEATIGVDPLRANWAEKLRETQSSGAILVVKGQRKPRAVLYRNEDLISERKRARRTATRREVNELRATAERFNELAVRLDAHMTSLGRIEERLEIIDRRFIDLWRSQQT